MTKWTLTRIGRLLARAGCGVRLLRAGMEPVSCRAVIQPLLYKNKMYVDNEMTAAGEVDSGCFLYLGPPEHRLDTAEDAVISCRRGDYRVVRADVLYWRDDPAYVRAILRPVIREGAYV